MKIVALVCRILLGACFVFFGANVVHAFLPQPPMSGPPAQFMAVGGMAGWMKVVGVCQVLGGLLVLAGGTVPLGLCILCPLTVNILCFHTFLMGGSGIAPGLLTALLELVLIYAYRASFAGIFSVRNQPSA